MQAYARIFCWNGMEEEFKYHLERLEEVFRLFYEGGLGIRNLTTFRQALRGEWLWSFSREDDRLWREVIIGRFAHWAGSVWVAFKGVCLMWWCGVLEVYCQGWEKFNWHTRFVIGDGDRGILGPKGDIALLEL